MLAQVPLRVEHAARFESIVGTERSDELRDELQATAEALDGRTLWHVNSTAAGGGVAEMLGVLLAYMRGAGIDVRWAVIGGNPNFFVVTKRLHNLLHEDAGDGAGLSGADQECYRDVTASNAEELLTLVRPDDVVVLHDPQTAGMVSALTDAGVDVIWRCHVGYDQPRDRAREAWKFLRPHLEPARLFVFSRQAHVHDWMPEDRVHIVPPSIDPFAPKNAELAPDAVRAVVSHLGVVAGDGEAPTYLRSDGTAEVMRRQAAIVRSGPPPGPEVPMLVQVSRWDRLKDMEGVMQAFAAGVDHGAHLALVGPAVAGVTDDPEGAEVYAECVGSWEDLPQKVRDRIQLVCLPMDDRDENAVMVNALQRHAMVVAQKSLAEGFGLTVTEAMWKGRPVVASAVGGIRDQIVSGEHGYLVDDPHDLDSFAGAVTSLLEDPAAAGSMGERARQRVIDTFLGNRHLVQYARLTRSLVSGG